MKPIRRKPRGEMNKAEARYAQDLELLKRAGKILDWKYEAIKFKLSDKTKDSPAMWYTPDFFIIYPDKFTIVELKGYKSGKMAASVVRFKIARQMYPWFDWQMIMINRWGGTDIIGMARFNLGTVKITREEIEKSKTPKEKKIDKLHKKMIQNTRGGDNE